MTAPGKARQRRSELRQKQNRRAKIRKLKARLEKAKTEPERQKVLAKLLKINPWYPIQELQVTTSSKSLP